MQSVTRRKRLAYNASPMHRRYDAPHLRICALKRCKHQANRRIVSQSTFSARNTVLSTGLIPAVQETLSLSLHLLPAGLRTFRCDRHARRNAEKPSSICAPAALLRLVNILHAVGAGCVLRRAVRTIIVVVRITFVLFTRQNGAGWQRKKRSSIQDRAVCINSISDYIFPRSWHNSSKDFIANGKFILAVSSEVNTSNMQFD